MKKLLNRIFYLIHKGNKVEEGITPYGNGQIIAFNPHIGRIEVEYTLISGQKLTRLQDWDNISLKGRSCPYKLKNWYKNEVYRLRYKVFKKP